METQTTDVIQTTGVVPTTGVIEGAGPVTRLGERPTVRLRDEEDAAQEPPRYAPEWLRLREPA
ncbi:SAM-dependent methyltransferase, partial [Streptomyces bobili]